MDWRELEREWMDEFRLMNSRSILGNNVAWHSNSVLTRDRCDMISF